MLPTIDNAQMNFAAFPPRKKTHSWRRTAYFRVTLTTPVYGTVFRTQHSFQGQMTKKHKNCYLEELPMPLESLCQCIRRTDVVTYKRQPMTGPLI